MNTFRIATLTALRSRLIAGLLFLTPFAITALAVAWLYNAVADIVRPALADEPAFVLPLTVIGLLVLVPLALGLLLILPLTRYGLLQFASLAKSVPVIGSIFRVGEAIATAVDPGTQRGLNRVVRVQYPKDGLWSLGFLTEEIDLDGEQWAVVFLPTAPLPNSGWVAIVRMDEVYEVDISASDAMTITLSAGMLTPRKLTSKRVTEGGVSDEPGSEQEPGQLQPNPRPTPVSGD